MTEELNSSDTGDKNWKEMRESDEIVETEKEPKALNILWTEFSQQLFYLSKFFLLILGKIDKISSKNSTAD